MTGIDREAAAGAETVAAPWPRLSIIVPVYNEEHTVADILHQLAALPYAGEKEIIVVDDGSTDGTPVLLAAWSGQPGVMVLRHERNRGKGAAVRTGLAAAHGEVIALQDADKEYEPQDLLRLVAVWRSQPGAAVYGSRYLRSGHVRWSVYRWGVVFLNGLVWLLYGQRLSDEATCYKVLSRDLWQRLGVQAEGFELCAEVTAKLCRLGVPILEIPIAYHPRSRGEGKKLRLRDGWWAVWELVRWRFGRWPACAAAATAPTQPPVS
jgi:dolichol-phosphate mannosyltransferase